MILQAGPDHLLAVVEGFRPDEAGHVVHHEGAEKAAKAVGTGLQGFDVAQKIAKTAGLTIVYYKKRQRQLPK